MSQDVDETLPLHLGISEHLELRLDVARSLRRVAVYEVGSLLPLHSDVHGLPRQAHTNTARITPALKKREVDY